MTSTMSELAGQHDEEELPPSKLGTKEQ